MLSREQYDVKQRELSTALMARPILIILGILFFVSAIFWTRDYIQTTEPLKLFWTCFTWVCVGFCLALYITYSNIVKEWGYKKKFLQIGLHYPYSEEWGQYISTAMIHFEHVKDPNAPELDKLGKDLDYACYQIAHGKEVDTSKLKEKIRKLIHEHDEKYDSDVSDISIK